MADTSHNRPERPILRSDLDNPENRYERGDVNFQAIGKFAIGLILTAIFCIGLVLGVFQFLLHREGGMPASRIEEPTQDARQLPPEPRLEIAPATDLKEMRAAEDKLLTNYTWLDKDSGVVALPIDRAMDLLVQRGLPARKETGPTSAAANVTVPTASALGPIMQPIGGPLSQQLQGQGK